MAMMRVLGRSEISVSAMGMGCWAIGGPFWRGETPAGWGEVDDAEVSPSSACLYGFGPNFF